MLMLLGQISMNYSHGGSSAWPPTFFIVAFVFLFVVSLILLPVPYLIAKRRNHSQTTVIAILCVCSLFMQPAWLAALIWAFMEDNTAKTPRPASVSADDLPPDAQALGTSHLQETTRDTTPPAPHDDAADGETSDEVSDPVHAQGETVETVEADEFADDAPADGIPFDAQAEPQPADQDGPGLYQVLGVHTITLEDVELDIYARSQANAIVKAELQNIKVTSCLLQSENS